MMTLLCLVLTAGCFLLGLLGGIFSSVLSILLGTYAAVLSVYSIRGFVAALRYHGPGPWERVAAQSMLGMNLPKMPACVLAGIQILICLVFTEGFFFGFGSWGGRSILMGIFFALVSAYAIRKFAVALRRP